MHSWLPDAHSQAPAPISALMSGVLLTVAFYAILRFKAICDLSVGPEFARTLLVIVALLSLAVAASLLLTQRDYKRMLAYHSIEHMGLIALGAAAGIPLAIAAVLLHILGHGLAKSVLFLTSGEIMSAEGTSQMDGVRSLLGPASRPRRRLRRRARGPLGLPAVQPLQRASCGMFRAEFQVGLGWAAVAAMVAMVVIFVAVASHARHMLLGPGECRRDRKPRRGSRRHRSSVDSWPVRRHRRVRLAAAQACSRRQPTGGAVIPTTSAAGDLVGCRTITRVAAT